MKKLYPQYDYLYALLSNGYGDRMLEREHFNDIITNITTYAVKFARAELNKERKENEKQLKRLRKAIDRLMETYSETYHG